MYTRDDKSYYENGFKKVSLIIQKKICQPNNFVYTVKYKPNIKLYRTHINQFSCGNNLFLVTVGWVGETFFLLSFFISHLSTWGDGERCVARQIKLNIQNKRGGQGSLTCKLHLKIPLILTAREARETPLSISRYISHFSFSLVMFSLMADGYLLYWTVCLIESIHCNLLSKTRSVASGM